MRKKFFIALICVFAFIGLTGCGNVKSESTIKDDLNKIVKDHVDADKKAGGYGTMTKRDLKKKLDSYSNYQLLDYSTTEFTTKPSNPTYMIKEFNEIDPVNNINNKYDAYFLIYDKDSDSYYSVKCDYDKEEDRPVFTDIKKLD